VLFFVALDLKVANMTARWKLRTLDNLMLISVLLTEVIIVLGDDTLKIWDIRNFKRFLNVAMNLPNFYPQ